MLMNFDKQTKDKNDLPRLLVIDGHGSHCTLPFVKYARENGIYVATYAPHTTHEMQGLDKIHFSVFKRYYADELARILRDTATKVTKANFLEIIAPVFEKTFTAELNKRAWEITGLIPFNPAVITPDRMAPSSETSTHLEAPAQLESPYRSIFKIAQSISSSRQNTMATAQSASDPPIPVQTANHSDTHDHNPFLVQPARYTPQSPTLARQVVQEAFTTASVGFLVDEEEPFDSMTPIPPLHFDPWPAPPAADPGPLPPHERSVDQLLVEVEMLKKELESLKERNARSQARLVLQSLYAARLKGKLYSKETEKKVNRQQLMSQKFARHLTSDEFYQALLDEEAARAAGLSEAERKKVETARKKELAKWRKARTEARGEQRQMDLEGWQEEVNEWEEEGRFGKKPVRPKMPPLEKTPEHLKQPPEDLDDEEQLSAMDIDGPDGSDSE